jgi:DNA-binding PadR family transcriptional regulator
MPKGKQEQVDRFLPLSLPVFHMLLALSAGERHGYALKREIATRTDGQINLASGALYGSINRMLRDELIVESDERPDPHLDDERRRYYAITPLGRRVLQADATRLRNLVSLAEAKLKLAGIV